MFALFPRTAQPLRCLCGLLASGMDGLLFEVRYVALKIKAWTTWIWALDIVPYMPLDQHGLEDCVSDCR